MFNWVFALVHGAPMMQTYNMKTWWQHILLPHTVCVYNRRIAVLSVHKCQWQVIHSVNWQKGKNIPVVSPVTLMLCLWAASMTAGTRSSEGSPWSSATPGGYQDKTSTPTTRRHAWGKVRMRLMMLEKKAMLFEKTDIHIQDVLTWMWWWKMNSHHAIISN